MKPHVLLVEDEAGLAHVLGDYLQADGFDVTWRERGADALQWLSGNAADLMLLDLGLPDLPGMEICRRVRARSALPIIMLSGRSSEIDRVLGLETGADDFVGKPYSLREVAARVRTVLRRQRSFASAEARAPEISFDDNACRVWIDGADAALTLIEYQLLRQMAQRPGFLMSRAQLMDGMYNDGRIVTERTIDSHIKKIRQKLTLAAPSMRYVHSVYGGGYRYEALPA